MAALQDDLISEPEVHLSSGSEYVRAALAVSNGTEFRREFSDMTLAYDDGQVKSYKGLLPLLSPWLEQLLLAAGGHCDMVIMPGTDSHSSPFQLFMKKLVMPMESSREYEVTVKQECPENKTKEDIDVAITRVICDFNNKCMKTFVSKKKKEIHIKVKHKGPKKFTCPDCGHQSNRTYDLNIHRKVHNKLDINCIDCGKKVKDTYRLEQHMATHHTIGKYSCPVCLKKFHIKYDLILHKKSCFKASNKLKFGYTKDATTSHPSAHMD